MQVFFYRGWHRKNTQRRIGKKSSQILALLHPVYLLRSLLGRKSAHRHFSPTHVSPLDRKKTPRPRSLLDFVVFFRRHPEITHIFFFASYTLKSWQIPIYTGEDIQTLWRTRYMLNIFFFIPKWEGTERKRPPKLPCVFSLKTSPSAFFIFLLLERERLVR